MLLAELASTSAEVAATSARRGKSAALARCLQALAPAEIPAAVSFLSGELRQRQIGVGFAALRELPDPAATPTLAIADVDAAFEAIGELRGAGSQAARRERLAALFGRATTAEQELLRRLLFGDLRQGALEGVMVDAVAAAADVPVAEVRRAQMLRGDLGDVAEVALTRGSEGLAGFRLEVGRPVLPMLAQTAAGIPEALAQISPAALEWKLDGARIQVHRDADEVAVFTRSLDDITARVPEVVEAALALPCTTIVLDGEVLALRADGRPHPFQVTSSRVGSRGDPEALRRERPLTPAFFDVLHLDGTDLLEQTAAARAAALAAVVPDALRVRRLVTADVAAAAAFLAEAIATGHEGVMAKALDAPYAAGGRGAGWLKVKPVHTLDLVVLAAEWGYGRRRGKLSNLHLGARDESGGFVMLGKTFKGLTDAMLQWQTERLLALATAETPQVVTVRPELVVEIAFDGVQTSTRYPGGVALRFARVKRHRPDKPAAEADTLAAVQAIRDAAVSPAADPRSGS